MRYLKPLNYLDFDSTQLSVFLAGSIEGDTGEWQLLVTQALYDLNITILNPRRNTWDASWPQSKDFAPFREQVEWELKAQESVDLIAFYFAPDTQAPITLLELGLTVGRKRAVVCCPEGFWRKGNIDILCAWYDIPQVTTIDALIAYIRSEAQLD